MTRRARIAVVGAGWWASTAHLPALVRDSRADLVGVCDPDDTRAQGAAREFGTQGFISLEAMIEDARPDGVVVATPHSTHFAVAAAALRAGCHVLVEKPLATAATDAWELVSIAKREDRTLAAGLTYQYAETAPAVRAAVHNDIGELRSVNAEFSSGTLALFAVTDPVMANLEDRAVPHGITYSDPATGGGQAHTQLSHLLGGVLWATGRQATDVMAMTESHGLAVDLVDALAFRLDGGALCVASSTGTTPPGVSVRHRIRFHGTEGMVEWDMLQACATVHQRGGRIELLENPPHLPAYGTGRVVESFVGTVLDQDPTPAPGYVAAASVSLIEAALQAATVGRMLPVPQAPHGVLQDEVL